MNMSNKTYDILKWIAMYLLPAAGTLYFALAGIWSFPNKRILRNNLCLPACKLLYLDKREKNFLLTDIISDIIIVRN